MSPRIRVFSIRVSRTAASATSERPGSNRISASDPSSRAAWAATAPTIGAAADSEPGAPPDCGAP